MAYSNPILSAVLGNQQQKMQNKQFEASLGLQIAQFAEKTANTKKDQAYRKSQSEIQVSQNESDNKHRRKQSRIQESQFKQSLGQNYAQLAQGAKQWEDGKPGRDAVTASNEATTANTTQKTVDLKLKQQAAQIKKTSTNYFDKFTTNGEPMSAEELFNNPQKMQSYISALNADGIRGALFSGSQGEDYYVKGITDVGNGRQVVELFDPKNPEKQMYLSKYRTAEEGDPISAGNAAGFGILKNQVDAAYFNSVGRPLPKAAQEMAETIAGITGANVGELNPQTVNAAFEVGAQLENQAQQPPEQQQTGETLTDVERVAPPVTHPAGGGEMPKASDGNTFGTVGGSSPTMLPIDTSVRNSDQMNAKSANRKTVNSALSFINTMEDVNFFDPEFLAQIPQSQINDEIKKREKLKQKIRPKATGLGKKKKGLTDEQTLERNGHDIAIDALTQLRDGPENGLNVGQQKAVDNAVRTESMPTSFVGTEKETAVVAQIAANAPPTPLGKEQVAKQIGNSLTPKPGKIGGKDLYNLKRLMEYGFIDSASVQRVLDIGVFSTDAVDIIKENISQNGQTTRAGSKVSNLNGWATFYNATGVYARVKTDLTNNQGLSSTEVNKIVDDYQLGVEEDGVSDTFKNLFTKHQLGINGYGSQPAVIKGLLNNAANKLIHDKAGISFMSDPYDWSVGGGSAPSQGATSLNRIVMTTDGEVFTVDRYGRRTNDQDMRLSDFSEELQTMIETTPHNTLEQARDTIRKERLTALKQIITNEGNNAEVKAYVDAELDRMEQDELAKGQ